MSSIMNQEPSESKWTDLLRAKGIAQDKITAILDELEKEIGLPISTVNVIKERYYCCGSPDGVVRRTEIMMELR